MTDTQLSPNMNITVPIALVRTGPAWASDVQTALYTTIDGHDHSNGKGARITPSGLNINADLTFASFNATTLRSARFASQGSALNLGTDIGCLYNVNGDAFWNNASGTAVQLTARGVVATPPAYNLKTLSTAPYVIPSSENIGEYWFSAAVVSSITLPQVSSVLSGRTYLFVDYLGTSESNPVSLTPNGTDTINGTNAAYTFSLKSGVWLVTTDGATGWIAIPLGASYLRAQGLTFAASATPLFTQAQSTTGAGTAWTMQSQAAKAGSAANGADFLFNTGAGDGAGRTGLHRLQTAGTDTFAFWPWQGSRNTQQGVNQRVPWQFNTVSITATTFFTFAIPNNSSVSIYVYFSVRQTGVPANAASGFAVVCATNQSGTVTTSVSAATTATLGTSPFTSITAVASGTSVLVKGTPASGSSIDWQGFVDVVSN